MVAQAAAPEAPAGPLVASRLVPETLKGLVLSGGAGTRLRPITHTSAKQLVPVANRPVLFYGLEALREAGVIDVGIVVGDTQAEIEAAVGDGSALGLRVTYIRQSAPLGLAHAVLTAEEYLDGSPFVMYLGDNLLRDGITALIDRFRAATCDALILLQRVPNPGDYGVAELDGGRVVRLVEKPAVPRSDLALVGVYMFSPAIMESAKAIRPSGRGELEITDAIQHLIDRGLVVEPHEVSFHQPVTSCGSTVRPRSMRCWIASVISSSPRPDGSIAFADSMIAGVNM